MFPAIDTSFDEKTIGFVFDTEPSSKLKKEFVDFLKTIDPNEKIYIYNEICKKSKAVALMNTYPHKQFSLNCLIKLAIEYMTGDDKYLYVISNQEEMLQKLTALNEIKVIWIK